MSDSNSNSTASTTKDELIETVVEQIEKPQSYSVDGESITQRSMADIESAIKLLNKMKVNQRDAIRCLGIARASTPGTWER